MTCEFIQTLFARRSIRKYTDEPVSESDIRTLLEAAMAAPSAANLTPWHFIVVTDRNVLDQLSDALPYGKMLFEAPLCIAVCGDTDMSPDYWSQDCSAATENLLLAANALGLGAVWLGVYPRHERVTQVREILRIPDTAIPLNIVSLGHSAEHKEARTQYEQTRVHNGVW